MRRRLLINKLQWPFVGVVYEDHDQEVDLWEKPGENYGIIRRSNG